MDSKTIEAIYPLTFLQQQLLLHSLSSKEEDQGFLQVTCKIQGPLKFELFKESWQAVVALHGAFRTSLHWEDLQKPVQAVHKHAEIQWQYLDLSQEKDQQQQIEQFLQTDKKLGLNFLKAPISRCALIKLAESEHLLVWSCHHLLFDGWSGKVALEHVLESYDALFQNKPHQPVKIPNYQSYVNWLSKLEEGKARKFWTEYLENFEKHTLLSQTGHESNKRFHFKERRLVIAESSFSALAKSLKNHRVTLSTFINNAWGLLLGKLSESQDVVFGTTVSGRSSGFPYIENMIGLFMNVLPVRVTINPELTFAQFMKRHQQKQLEAFEFQYIDQGTINTWIETSSNQQLYDSLVLTQNFMSGEIEGAQLTLTELKGKVTSTQTLTIITEPGQNLEITLRYNPEIVNPLLIEWISISLKDMVSMWIDDDQLTVEELQHKLEPPPSSTQLAARMHPSKDLSYESTDSNYIPPSNSLELELTKIWEELIGLYPIGVDDNFFEVGGDSFKALQLISKVGHQLNKQLSPTTLIQYPTIRSMVNSWKSESSSQEFPSLVPIRARGSKPPLFVIHGGGGHVFFYYPMVKHMDQDQPVFALQPVGLFGESEMHHSIKDMAKYYLETIKSVVPSGSFSILSTCLSDPICIEINNEMRKQGQAPLAMVIVDSSPLHLIPRKRSRANLQTRISRFKKRYQQSASKALKKIFVGRYNKAVQPIKHKFTDLSIKYGSNQHARNLLEIQKNLRKLYTTYKWEKFDGKVTLIKTQLNRSWDEEIWGLLAKGGVKVISMSGSHYSRFEEPYVITMAQGLQKELDELQHKKSVEKTKDTSIDQSIQ